MQLNSPVLCLLKQGVIRYETDRVAFHESRPVEGLRERGLFCLEEIIVQNFDFVSRFYLYPDIICIHQINQFLTID